MKIKIISNSHEMIEQAQKAFSNIDFSYGFSAGASNLHDITEENSWTAKTLKYIDGFFSKKNPLSEKESHVAKIILEQSLNLSDYLSKTDFSHLNKTQLFLSSNSLLNSKIQKLAFGFFSKKDDSYFANHKYQNFTFTKILFSTGFKSPLAFPYKNKVFINSDFFLKDEKEDFFMGSITNKFGLNKTVSFTLLHEFSHVIEISNRKEFNFDVDPKFLRLLTSLNELSVHSDVLKLTNKHLESMSEHGWKKIQHNTISELNTMNQEVYADVHACLFMRNMSIKEKTFNSESEKQFIQHLANIRRKEYHEHTKSCQDASIMFNHLSAEGLEYLHDIYDTLPQQELSPDEMNTICSKAIEVNLSRTILVMLHSIDGFYSQLKSLVYLKRLTQLNSEGEKTNIVTHYELNKSFLEKDLNHHDPRKHLKDYIDYLKDLSCLGRNPQWYENFLSHTKTHNSLNFSFEQTNKLNLLAGLDAEKLKKIQEKYLSIKTDMDELYPNKDNSKSSMQLVLFPTQDLTTKLNHDIIYCAEKNADLDDFKLINQNKKIKP